MFGLTASAQTLWGPTGPIGHQGKVGLTGIPGIPPDKKLVTIFCKKDYGFIKSGQYVRGFFTEFLDGDRVSFFHFISEDDKMRIYLNEKESDEYFIWKSNDLRQHKLGSIGM